MSARAPCGSSWRCRRRSLSSAAASRPCSAARARSCSRTRARASRAPRSSPRIDRHLSLRTSVVTKGTTGGMRMEMPKWGRFFGFAWRRIGDASNVQFLLPAAWWAWLMSGATGVVASAGGILARIPFYLWVPLGALAFLAVSVAVNLLGQRAAPSPVVPAIRASRAFMRRPRGPDILTKIAAEEWTYWSKADEMKLWQAAYLWTGVLPPKNRPADLPPLVRAQAERMERALQRGDLVSKVTFNDDAHPALRLLDR